MPPDNNGIVMSDFVYPQPFPANAHPPMTGIPQYPVFNPQDAMMMRRPTPPSTMKDVRMNPMSNKTMVDFSKPAYRRNAIEDGFMVAPELELAPETFQAPPLATDDTPITGDPTMQVANQGNALDLNIPSVDPSTGMPRPSLSANLGGRGVLDSGTGANDTLGIDVPATDPNRKEVRSLPVHQMSKIGHAVLAARNHFQAPPPSVQVARTHLERNTFDDRLYEQAKDNAQASAVASMEMMRGQISNPADLMRAAHAVTQGTQDTVANIDMQRAAAKQQVVDSNVAIANQEQQIQDQQNTQEMLMNYQNMQQFAREKTQAVSAELSNVEQAFMNEANYLEAKEAQMKQRAIDKQYRDEKVEVDRASMEILANKGFESTEGYASGRLEFLQSEQLKAEASTRQALNLGDDYIYDRDSYKADINKYQQGMVKAAQNEATLKAFQQDVGKVQADLDSLDPSDEQFAEKQKSLLDLRDAAQQEYDNRLSAQEGYKKDLTTLKQSIDVGGAYYDKFQELFDKETLNERYRSQYMKDRGIRPDMEIIDDLYDRLKSRRDVEADIVRPDLGQ